jgi:serine/threonine protein kinase
MSRGYQTYGTFQYIFRMDGRFVICVNVFVCVFYELRIILTDNTLFLLGGSISVLLSKYGPFEEAILISYAQQILQGVAYLHQHQVIHRDIKGNSSDEKGNKIQYFFLSECQPLA